MFRKGNRTMEISLRTTQKEILLSTLWYHQFDSSHLRDAAMSTEHECKSVILLYFMLKCVGVVLVALGSFITSNW